MTKIILILAAFLAGIGLTIGGIALWPHIAPRDNTPPPPELVRSIRIALQKYVDAQVEGNRVDVPKRPSTFALETPDYFLEIELRSKEVITTEPFIDTPVGNGIEWAIEPPLVLGDIREVRLIDTGLVKNTLVDRVLIDSRVEEGQFFSFTLKAGEIEKSEEGRVRSEE